VRAAARFGASPWRSALCVNDPPFVLSKRTIGLASDRKEFDNRLILQRLPMARGLLQQGAGGANAAEDSGENMRNVSFKCAVVLGAIVTAAAGCGSGSEGPALDVASQALTSTNGMSSNGLSVNGLSSNGMSSNGLSSNGLSSNGLSSNGLTLKSLSTSTFTSWWTSQTESYAAMVMKYVVRCGLPSTSSLTYTAPSGVTYTWQGNLGLTPTWASGKSIPVIEQQLMSACLAAHANAYGINIGISVLGLNASGKPIPQAAGELTTYSFDEGAFYGNLFDGTGIFACADTNLPNNQSSNRGCALNNGGVGTASFCPQITYTGTCGHLCTKSTSTNPYWDSCTVSSSTGSVAYRPLTTHIGTSDINLCGDGICQISEIPGNSTAWNNCSDCP
jgi:hypothetical protein